MLKIYTVLLYLLTEVHICIELWELLMTVKENQFTTNLV